MAGFSRYEQYQPSQYLLPKVDLGILANVLQAKQQRFDTGYELANQLKNKYIDPLQADKPLANTLEQGWQKKIDDLVKEYDGDYTQMYRGLRGLESDINREFSPGGRAGTMQARKIEYSDWYKEQEGRVAKNEILGDQLNAMAQHTLENYKGIGEKDPITGNYKGLGLESINKYVDPFKFGREIIKEMDPHKFSVEQDSLNGKYIVRSKESGEVLKPEEIQNVVGNSLLNNREYMAYIDQYQRSLGHTLTDQELESLVFDSIGGTLGQVYQIDNRETSQTLHPDQVALTYFTEGQANRRAAARLAADDARFKRAEQIMYNKGTLDYIDNRVGKELNIEDLRSKNLRYTNNAPITSP